MSALRELEREFQQYVYQRDSGMDDKVADTGGLGARARLDIYADAYRLRLLEVLENDYPGLKALATADRFETLGRAYIEAQPSSHFNIRWYGRNVAEFLRTTDPWRQTPALVEMAALEWAMSLVFDAPDHAVASAADVASLAPERWATMQPEPLAALRRLELNWNAAQIRKAVDRHTEVPESQRLAKPESWLVWRRELTVYYRELEADEAWGFDQAREGANFGQLCEGLCQWHETAEVAGRAAGLLKRWLDDGLIHRIRSES